MKILTTLLISLPLVCAPLAAVADKGGNKGPNEQAWEHANDNASFKRGYDGYKRDHRDRDGRYGDSDYRHRDDRYRDWDRGSRDPNRDRDYRYGDGRYGDRDYRHRDGRYGERDSDSRDPGRDRDYRYGDRDGNNRYQDDSDRGSRDSNR